MTLHNPETGEVVVAQAGETVFFQTDAWHYGYNFGSQEKWPFSLPLRPVTYIQNNQKADLGLAKVFGGRIEGRFVY